MDVLVHGVSFFFTARIREAARHTGARLLMGDPSVPLVDEVARVRPDIVLLELERCDLEQVRALRAREAFRGVRVYGFGAHVNEELFAAAREAGFDAIVPKGALGNRLEQWLEEVDS